MPHLESSENTTEEPASCKEDSQQPRPNTAKEINIKRKKKKWPESHLSCLLLSGTWFETFLYNFHLWSTPFGEQVQGIELQNGKQEGQGEKEPRVYFLNTKSSIGPPPIICSVLSARSSPAWHPGIPPA